MPLNHTSKYAELTDQQFLLIGKLTIEFSNIEFLLGEILSRLLVTPSFLSRTYTERMNVNSIIDKIKNAVDIHARRYNYQIISEDLCDSIKDKTIEANQIRIKRNKFAHHCWSRISDDKIFGTEFLSKQFKSTKPNEGSIEISNMEIEELYEWSYKLVDELEKTLQKLPELLEDKELKDKLKYE